MVNCKLCGRPLKSKRSIKLKYGPTCIKKTDLIIKRGKIIGVSLIKEWN